MKSLRILFLLLLLPIYLHAAITATYEPVPALHFEKGFSPLNTNKLIAHIGTLTIHADGEELFDPNILNVNLSIKVAFTGPMQWGGLAQIQETFFHIYAVSTVNGVTQANPLWYDSMQPLRSENGNLNVANFVAELYLVGDQDWSRYTPNATYTMTQGMLGGFKVGVANSEHGYNGSNSTLISVNGNPPKLPSPQITIKGQQAISLHQAIGSLTTRVAEAEVVIHNGANGKQYAVDVVFTNLFNTSPFHLVWQGGGSNPPSIPYSLHFNNSNVTPGQPIRWEGLTHTPQSKDILVTGFTASAAQQALAGYYQDTIIVNVIPVNTI
ncbi:MAG: hypothetical protein WC233_09235 [Sphaerochaeta sp.]|jgi:hypothetical protein